MKWTKQMAEDLQILAEFCGVQDVPALTHQNVSNFFDSTNSKEPNQNNHCVLNQKQSMMEDAQINQEADSDLKNSDEFPADLLVLFGGSIMQGMENFMEGLENHVAKTSVIVGGYGHTTAALQKKMETAAGGIYPTEAETFQAALNKRGYSADLLEKKSTNCGNNITLLLELLKEHQIPISKVIFIQDASMQKRMEATLHKYRPDVQVLNFPSSRTFFTVCDSELLLENSPAGMWEPEKFASLLMGEIQRLRDDENGYGPKGKDFIAHIEIPDSVLDAYERLAKQAPQMIRSANPAYSKAL